MGYTMSSATILLLGIILTAAVAEAKLADTSIVKGPDCIGRSDDASYNKKVERLVDIFIDETKNVHRGGRHASYEYKHSYPDSDSGSVNGGATCDERLWKLDCWACLLTAKNKINSNCERTRDAEIKLADCSLWFKMIQ